MSSLPSSARRQRARDRAGAADLSAAVAAAIETLGRGYLAHPANRALRDRLASGELAPAAYFSRLTVCVLRVLVLLAAGARQPDRRHFPGLDRLTGADAGAGRAAGEHIRELYAALCEARVPGAGFPADAVEELLSRAALDDGTLRRVLFLIAASPGGESTDLARLGPLELAGVHQALLQLRPSLVAGRFSLPAGGRSARKRRGSYYTPPPLIEILLDATLDPLLRDAAAAPVPEAALLRLRLCDPACGSGLFLAAAARRIAGALAAVRAGGGEASEPGARRALHDVVAHCLYGVDVSPVAVELCRLTLWLEADDPALPPLPLDARIRVGDSLLGATPAALERGVPDAAFRPLDGDEPRLCREARLRNRMERQAPADATRRPPEGMRGDGNDPGERRAADAWCAAFLWPKRAGAIGPPTQALVRRLRAGQHPPPALGAEIRRLRAEHGFFHWHLEFPGVFQPTVGEPEAGVAGPGWEGGFDVVVGNPPFVNAIEGSVAARLKPLIAHLHPRLSGTADLAYYFLDLGLTLLKPGGRLGMVQPRAVLNAASAAELRRRLRPGFRPSLLFTPRRADLFAGASTFVCLVALGSDELCRVGREDEPARQGWRTVRVKGSNWWSVMDAGSPRAAPATAAALRLGDVFRLGASMTAADAYEVRPWVRDERRGTELKLVTTGLIDPGACLWGERPCRYLGGRYAHPRVSPSGAIGASLQRRLRDARRPKLLVAGLSPRIECFVDRRGEFVGAVSTYSIYHPADDVRALARLAALLLGDDASCLFRAELGASAMGGGSITMRKSFLAEFALPASFAAGRGGDRPGPAPGG